MLICATHKNRRLFVDSKFRGRAERPIILCDLFIVYDSTHDMINNVIGNGPSWQGASLLSV